MEVALYNCPKTFTDVAIRLWTWSKYSHTELRFDRIDDGPNKAHCFSSSGRDGGTRFKEIDLTNGRWDRVTVNIPTYMENRIHAWCERRVGRKYDFKGIFGFVFGKNFQDPIKWYCSEICAAALRCNGVFDFPHKISPGKMAKFMRKDSGLFVPV